MEPQRAGKATVRPELLAAELGAGVAVHQPVTLRPSAQVRTCVAGHGTDHAATARDAATDGVLALLCFVLRFFRFGCRLKQRDLA